MENQIIIVAVSCFLGSLITFFTGFGLGTLLMPVLAVFFPPVVAIAATAIIHFLNNLFKFALVGKYTDKSVVLSFGFPAVAAAFLGSFLLVYTAELPAVADFPFFGSVYTVTPLNLLVGLLIMFFAFVDLSPALINWQVARKYLSLGGLLSGFFGGISGHQGAFRSMFLIKLGLSKESFVATGAAVALMVDITRLMVYGIKLTDFDLASMYRVIGAGVLAAFAGSLMGRKLLKQTNIHYVHKLVAWALFFLGFGIIFGAV
jgi:uncharacterized membrane protein YfcA